MDAYDVAVTGEHSIFARFAEFHLENPEVYWELLRLAREAKAKGHKRIGIQMIWEVLRWNLTVAATPSSGLVLNNNYTAHYARLLMHWNPELNDFFELRRLRTP